MSHQITNCPICSTKLKMMSGRMTCKECGYYIRNTESENTQTNYTTYQSTPQQTYTNNPYPTSYTPTSSTNQTDGWKASSKPGRSAAIGTLLAIGGVGLIVGFGKVALKNVINDAFSSGQRADITSMAEEIQREESIIQEEESTASIRPEITITQYPESDFFIEMVEVIWNKAYTDITAEEYASLTALGIYRSDNVIYYQIDGQELQTLTFVDGSGMDFSDFACFSGLEWLAVDSSLYSGDLDGLNHLCAVHAENTIDEYLDIIPNPENILELSVEASIFEESLAGIENFPNLMCLSVEYGALKDISALTSLPYLYELTLQDCNDLTDYSPLMSLTGLEYLSIQSNQLKSIDFVKVMPNLTGLAIEDSQITNLNALADCTNLTYLYLMNNYNVTDYSVISNLTQLYSLTFSATYDNILPSLANLTCLEELTMDGVRDISLLKDAVNVTYLCMSDCSGWELESITAMQELNTLVINDFASLTESVEPLTHLPKLEALDLSETSIFGNMEEIFGIPTLRYLYLDDCQVGMDFTKIPTNEALEVLSMNNLRVLVDPSYNSGVTISLAEHTDMFSKFPNLSDLYVASLQLDNIEFVSNLPNLQCLDITNNNVTSLKPLESLSNFQIVWCGSNTILENLPADSSIRVMTSDQYY